VSLQISEVIQPDEDVHLHAEEAEFVKVMPALCKGDVPNSSSPWFIRNSQ
jgi:hypothetical protein